MINLRKFLYASVRHTPGCRHSSQTSLIGNLCKTQIVSYRKWNRECSNKINIVDILQAYISVTLYSTGVWSYPQLGGGGKSASISVYFIILEDCMKICLILIDLQPWYWGQGQSIVCPFKLFQGGMAPAPFTTPLCSVLGSTSSGVVTTGV